jgi:hypothetical protein
MSHSPPGAKQMIAFKVGARARKFALEGCPIEGYEILYTALAETRESDPEMHALLAVELEKYERRVAEIEAEEA